MSILSTILEKLGLSKPAAAAPKPGGPAIAPSMGGQTTSPTSTPGSAAPGGVAAGAKPMAMVDVVSKLNNMAGQKSGLDWKVSIVDLLKLLNMDSSLTARKELANELGCPPNLIGGDYSKMNVWLHQAVMQKIADNGGNIPASLLKS